MLDAVADLARRLRDDGFDTATSDVVDALNALSSISLDDRRIVRESIRCCLVKHADPEQRFDHHFDAVFGRRTPRVDTPTAPAAQPITTAAKPTSNALHDSVLGALLADDADRLAQLATMAVDELSGFGTVDGSDRYFTHRVLRALDLTRMLSAAMQRLRAADDLGELDLMLRRTEIAAQLEMFRRQIAAAVAARRAADDRAVELPSLERTAIDDVDLLALSADEFERVRAALQPLIRRLAAKLNSHHRLRSTGRLDMRRTIRRSLSSGGVPVDIAARRRWPRRPDIVVLCDVSGSVAEFAQFTFTLLNALHREARSVRSFAFVDGVAEVTDVIASARHDVAVNRFVERKGVVGLDGHSDYGAVLAQFDNEFGNTIGPRTTIIITGDGRGNYRDGRRDALESLCGRARRVYWLNPEHRGLWGNDDSLIDEYGPLCTAVHEVRTLRQLEDAIADLV